MFCVWLLPSDLDAQHIGDVISANMSRLKRPVFSPHMTLFDSEKKLNSSCKEAFSCIVKRINECIKSALTFRVMPCVYGTAFYKSFFCEIEYHETLRILYEEIRQLDTKSTYQLYPHISLAYGRKDKVLKTIDLKTITFDKIALIVDNNEESDAAIRSWKIIDSYKLRGR